MISVLAANAKRTIDGITGQSTVLFSSASPVQNLGPPPLKLKKILDMAPITVTDQTPMETVVDMFRKLGLRQILVTHNGYVCRCQYLPFYCSTHVFFFYLFLFYAVACWASSPRKTFCGTWNKWTTKIPARFSSIRISTTSNHFVCVGHLAEFIHFTKKPI